MWKSTSELVAQDSIVGRPKFDFHTGRVWKKSVQYDVRKSFADTRLRVKGRFVKKEDEVLLKELVGLA